MKKIVLLGIIICATHVLFAQSYPDDREKFIKEFEKLLSTFIEKEQKDFIKDELRPMLLETSNFSDAYFKKMVETCNLMETKKQKVYPVIYNYVFSVYSFVKNKQPNSSYVAWHSSIDKLLDNRNVNKFQDFIELSAGFFSKRELASSTIATWIYRGGTYTFEFSDKPFINFEGGRLVCLIENSDKREKNIPYVDSVVIYDATGVYDPILKKWDGHDGTLTWEKVGLSRTETFASLTKYDISLKSSNFICDTVTLTTPYFDKPIKGKLTDRAFRINREEDKIYPQFLSYNKRLKINQITENVDYEGGFSLQGKDFVGLGVAGNPASLKISRNGKTFVYVKSQLVIVNKKKITCPQGMFSMYIGLKDSIFHPGLEFTYDLEAKALEFIRGTTGISQSPFSNTLHQVDMYVPKLVWPYDSPEISLTYNFGTSLDQRYARLESKNYFDGRLFDQLQGLEKVHPLAAIYDYCLKYDEYVMNEGKIATAMGKTIEQAKPIMLQLASLGFINYDTESKMVSVNPKLGNFIKAKSNKMDFDNLIFLSDMRPKKVMGVNDEDIKKAEDRNKELVYAKSYNKKEIKSLEEKIPTAKPDEKIVMQNKIDELNNQLKIIETELSSFEQKAVLDNVRKNESRKGLDKFGTLNIGTLEIKLDAVDNIPISDAQKTIVFPDQSKVIIKENRNFNFNGWIICGKIEVNSLEANYVYNTNKINLFKTEKSIFVVRPLRPEDGKESITMINEIEGLTGELLIDDPKNRSGFNKKITDFPKMVISKPSYVYYNNKSIYRGAYDSTRFFFTVDPFEMDSLDNFVEKHQRFIGELTSAGIFPKFRDSLKIMPDYSFGFVKQAPKEGYDFYSKDAKYNSKIVLSGQGLQGAGTINFVHSSSFSKAFTFLPDSTLGYATFDNKAMAQGVQFPDMNSPEAYITFIPRGNVLKAASTPTQEINMFDKQARMKGTIFITPQGSTGTGVVTFKDANLGSELLKFKRWDIDADTANFNLKNNFKVDDEDPLALKTENLNAHISFEKRKGEFRSNSGESKVEFPVNQYLCKMDFFTWFMDEEAIELSTSADRDLNLKTDLDLLGANFFSLHPDQDSLRFRSREAKYSLREKTIYCSKVEYLDIADARIYPDSSKLIIRKKARMDPLENSVIVANSVTKYHRFIHTKTEVKARRVYESEGDYPYYDADSTMTIIKMKKIGVDSSFQTVATGKIGSKDNFKLSKQFEFYGDVRINSNVPLITFSGATRINHDCKKFTRSWMAFKAEIDPKNIQIPVSTEMKSLDSLSLSAGIVWRDSKTTDGIRMYPTFLSQLEDKGDPIVFTSNGVLQYDYDAKEFQIGSKEKLINRNEKGNYLALHTESCSLNGDGVIKLGMDYGQVTVDAVGVVNYNQENGLTTMNITAKYNFPIEDKSFEKISYKILETPDLKPMDFGSTTFEKALVEWIDRETADKIKSTYTLDGEYKRVPSQARGTIVITGLRLSSFVNPSFEQRGIYTESESAAIVSIYDKPIMKYVPVRAFFQQIYSGNGGDALGLMISNPAGSDYFLDYKMLKKEGELLIYTNDGDLEAAINALKPDKRKSKDFSYEVNANRMYLNKFLKLFGVE